MREPSPVVQNEDAFVVEALGPRLFITTMRGRITYDLAEKAYQAFLPIVETMDQPVWLSDATRLTGFEPKTLALGPRWFIAYKRRGGSCCLVASPWERAIMAARTMALGLGVKVRAYPDIAQARQAARELLGDESMRKS